MDIDEFAPRLSFFFDAHIDFFEEIAKFRAARRIWARWMRDRYDTKDERSQKLRFHTQTAGVSLTAQQPDNNVVRTTVEALAAVMGGTQSLHTNALDEVYALPTERAAEIALRTQQVLMEETGVADVIDPLGGSWFVEQMTDRWKPGSRNCSGTSTGSATVRCSTACCAGSRRAGSRPPSPTAPTSSRRPSPPGRRVIVGVNKYVVEDERRVWRSCGSAQRSRAEQRPSARCGPREPATKRRSPPHWLRSPRPRRERHQPDAV